MVVDSQQQEARKQPPPLIMHTQYPDIFPIKAYLNVSIFSNVGTLALFSLVKVLSFKGNYLRPTCSMVALRKQLY
jgi:hypothetical protein